VGGESRMNRDNTPGILVSGQDLGGSVDRGVKGGQWGCTLCRHKRYTTLCRHKRYTLYS